MIKVCKQCEKEFNTDRPDAKFCSRDCTNVARRKVYLRPCEHCGEQFHNINKAVKYCSQSCYHKSKIKILSRNCLICGKSFKPVHDGTKYCSKKCNGIAYRTVEERNCETCGKTYKPKGNDSRYCSYNCKFNNKIKQEKTLLCIECGKPYQKYRDNHEGFCTRKCKCENMKRSKTRPCAKCGKLFYRKDIKILYCGRECFFKAMQSGKETKIETELYAFLDNIKIKYDRQYYLKFTIPDAFIKKLNLCIYADGRYWHSKKINKGKDSRQNKKLKALGYNVIRLNELDNRSLDLEPLKLLLKIE